MAVSYPGGFPLSTRAAILRSRALPYMENMSTLTETPPSASFRGYVSKTLARGEQIVYRANFNWTYSLFPSLWFALGLSPALLFGYLQFFVGLDFQLLRWGWIFCAIGASAGSLILFSHIVHLITTEIVVTTFRFVFKIGLISRNTQEVSLNKIEEITLSQSILGRIFNYGSVVLRGTGVGVITLPNLDEPIAVRRIIEDARAALRNESRDERTGDAD